VSKAIAEIGEIVVGAALIVAGALTANPMLIKLGVGVTIAGVTGLVADELAPGQPTAIGNTGLLPVEQPNALWRIQYGVFQAAAALISFIDGPNLAWAGTPSNAPCENQYLNLVHTLACHQIAGFMSVTIDGETFNFGSDLQLLSLANNPNGYYGAGLLGFRQRQ
jgi:hypothetical protein